jgi:hypothetical protein
MNSKLSLNVVNSILNSPFRHQMTKQYTTLLKSYLVCFGLGQDDDTFYGIVLQNSEYHLQRYKKAGKKAKKSKIEFNKCIDFVIKHYIYYLKETGKKEAEEIQNVFEKKSGVKYDREEIHKLMGYEEAPFQSLEIGKKRKRTPNIAKVVKRVKLNDYSEEEPNIIQYNEKPSKIILFCNFIFMVIAIVLHFKKLEWAFSELK